MTREEFDKNRRRFGDDIDAWPPPLREPARAFMARESDDALDRLVRQAALVEGDDRALARKVMARIDRGAPHPSLLPRFLIAPTGFAASAAALLIAATIAGYQVARLQDQSQDSELLALAAGARLPDDGGQAIAGDAGEGDAL
ncbi:MULTISPECIES: hypothetical protein [unclassified Mesorhizobium]|uniref:hypothetical protein n=1 Tax=unclassified Mesorhizobium TaxID=325217 RepID=UPI000FDA5DD2|nr:MULTISPECIES: hypothetical protein [unclassified Mesorhizobium]TGQ12400.1 hypothetical protein EN862_016090 [Mesorhizobium sp. M2E.F.Ca.ET.219.01.1.1]TGT68222.1 hypothetical protein EN809_027360 [Mesorhizobium sp. M2E.F.Ca.ET.166.01.1.1]TGW01225.1 hypothetical protein EN797_012670 [Mesorhizobium sp. M2E.F.Ca.ET.154.01.1.1]